MMKELRHSSFITHHSAFGVWAVVVGIAVVAVATVGALRGVAPFPTWYYVFAWYGTLIAGSGWWLLLGERSQASSAKIIHAQDARPERDRHDETPPPSGGRSGRGRQPGESPDPSRLFSRRSLLFLLSLLAWSAVVWLFFELVNFRLQNWYYVFLSNGRAERWIGTLVAFATVFPALFLPEAILHRLGVARAARSGALRLTDTLLVRCQLAGAVILGLVFIWPRVSFPLVWGAVMLLADPVVYRRARDRSLLGDLERGRPGRIYRLLLGGLAAGMLWELFNMAARAKWIYTVPGFEELKLFEMPVLGFLGFPPFALECFVLWQLLVVTGLAVPRTGATYPAPSRRRLAAAIIAPVFSILVLAGMDKFTVSSLAPRLEDLPGVPAARLSRAGIDPFRLASSQPKALGARFGVTVVEASRWVEAAKLATLRGIGTRHAAQLNDVGITSVDELARADASALAAQLERRTGRDVVDARVRVWVRAANAMMSAE